MVLIIGTILFVLLAIAVPLSLIYCSLKVVTLSANVLQVSWIILCVVVANYSHYHWWGA
jgi:hypothetical protein